MPNQSDFQARLERLNAKSATSPSPGLGPMPVAGRFTTAHAIVGAVLSVFTIVAVAFIVVMPSNASIADEVTIDTPVQPGGKLISWIAGQDSHAPSPGSYLPNPHSEWIRITTQDAGEPAIDAIIEERWARATGLSAAHLEQNLGYSALRKFIKTYRKPDIEMRVLSKTRSRAMYLHSSGAFLSIEMKFLTGKSVMGPPDSGPNIWLRDIMAEHEKKLGHGKKIERVKLGALEVANIYAKVGMSSRPLLEQQSRRNGVRIFAPFGPRTLVKVRGVAPLKDIRRYLGKFDADALFARLD